MYTQKDKEIERQIKETNTTIGQKDNLPLTIFKINSKLEKIFKNASIIIRRNKREIFQSRNYDFDFLIKVELHEKILLQNMNL